MHKDPKNVNNLMEGLLFWVDCLLCICLYCFCTYAEAILMYCLKRLHATFPLIDKSDFHFEKVKGIADSTAMDHVTDAIIYIFKV